MAILKVLPARSNVAFQKLNPLLLSHTMVVREKRGGGNGVLIRISRLPMVDSVTGSPLNSRRATGH